MRKTTAILMVFLLLFSLVHSTGSFVSAMYGTKIIDGNLNDWMTSDLIAVGQDTGQAGANLDRLYVAWDDQYLYIAIKTNNTQSWDVAYGIGIDVDPGTGNGYTGTSDSWGRGISFGNGYAIDYELYFWWGGSSGMGTDNFNTWTGNGWNYNSISDVGGSFAYTGDTSTGLQTLEIAIPWSALGGKPSKIAIISWIAGGDGSSAVDSLPVDPTTTDDPNEWVDADTFTNLAEIPVAPKTIDGDLNDWGVTEVAAEDKNGTGVDGGNLTKLYVSWDDQYLYIAIETNNKQNWGMAYGFGIDVDPGTGNGYTTGGDAWGRSIEFSNGYALDYEVYFWWDDGSASITSAQLNTYTGGWDWPSLEEKGGKYAYTGDSTNGLKTLEIAIPWSALGGMPSKFAVAAWITGGDGSAVDILPQENVAKDNANEWGDVDTITEMANFEIFTPAPDLTVSINGSPVVEVNKTVEYAITVKNLGSAPVSNVEVKAYANETPINSWTIDLGVEEEKELTFTWTPDKIGAYVLKVTVDENNLIEESNEENNVATLVVWATKIKIDGNLNEWTAGDLVAVGRDTGLAGANLDKLFVSWDNQYLYIAIKTNNTEHWNTVLGLGIDVDPGTGNGYVGADQDGDPSNGFEDIWWRNIGFGGGYAIDYELYFWYDSGNKKIGGGDFKHWNGNGWEEVGIENVRYASSPDLSFGTVELVIPWGALGGRPEKIALITWLAGADAHTSAIDTLPVDPDVDYITFGESEWTDKDILTNLTEISLIPKPSPAPTPDLTVTITGPNVVEVNKEVEYTITVRNLGSVPVSNVEVKAYANETPINSWTIDLNESDEKKITLKWRPDKIGSYTLKVTVDENNLIEEANEDNNVATMDVKVVWIGKIIVDGNPDDWPEVNLPDNTYTIVNGTFIWKDAENDHRTDKDKYLSETGHTSTHADLTEVAVTKDDRYVYFLFKFKDMSNMKLGANGATFIAVPIDYKEGGKAGRFAGSMDMNSVIDWDIQMAVNLKCSGCTGSTVVMPAGDSIESMLYFVDPDNNVITVDGAVVAVNLTANTVEVKVPVEVFEGATEFKFQVATGLSWGAGVWNFGDPFNDDDVSDAVDVLSDKPTKEEVIDGYLDYYIDIKTNGAVKEAKAIDYTLVRRGTEMKGLWGKFLALTKYHGVWHFQNDYERYLELREYFENASLPEEIKEKARKYDETVNELVKLYNDGKENIDNGKFAFGASLKIFRAYTGLKKVLKEMEELKKTAEEGNFERLQYMKELSKNLTKTIDGNLDDWNVPPVAVDEVGYGQDGANLKALYVDYDDQFLYIALTTENKASWRVAYGISLDYKDSGYTGDQDSWGKKVSFSRGIDAQLYFFWNGEFFGDPGTSTITSAQLVIWNGNGWEYKDLQLVGFYAYTGGAEDGLQTLEIAIPWEALGVKPGEINIVAYVTGQAVGDSAVDSLPLQDAVRDTDPGQEWSDADTFTQFVTVTIE